MSCGVGLRLGSDPALLWLWHRPVAAAPIEPLAWEPPQAVGVALEKGKRQKKRTKPIYHSFKYEALTSNLLVINHAAFVKLHGLSEFDVA